MILQILQFAKWWMMSNQAYGAGFYLPRRLFSTMETNQAHNWSFLELRSIIWLFITVHVDSYICYLCFFYTWLLHYFFFLDFSVVLFTLASYFIFFLTVSSKTFGGIRKYGCLQQVLRVHLKIQESWKTTPVHHAMKSR